MTTPQSKEKTRLHIIHSTLACIEKYGLSGSTTRNIAAEASVNIAAINYYFDSKEHLILTALENAITHSQADVTIILETGKLSPRQKIRAVFVYFLNGLIRYPNITGAYFSNQVSISGISAHSFLSGAADKMILLLKSLPDAPVHLELDIVQAFSAIICIGQYPSMFQHMHSFCNFKENAYAKKEYVDYLMSTYFNWLPE